MTKFLSHRETFSMPNVKTIICKKKKNLGEIRTCCIIQFFISPVYGISGKDLTTFHLYNTTFYKVYLEGHAVY
jgi:hypothetical protein